VQRSTEAAPADASANTRGFPADALYFRPDIEGLRGVSVLLVLLFHLQIGMFAGGFVGVDVFYVISGFLITQIILRDLRARQFRLVDFYLRRACRILPAYIVMLAGAALVAYALFLPPAIWSFDTALKASLLFISNIVYANQTGYFMSEYEFNPLLHTWSLSVEEQFYICIPIILMVTTRWLAPARLYTGLLVASLIAAIIGGLHDQSIVFFSSTARFWEFLSGALVAIIRPRTAPAAHRWIGIAGAVSLALSLVLVDGASPFPFPSPGLAVIGAAGLICGGENLGAGSLLSHRIVRFFGAISYSIYLWHWPIIVYTRYANILPLNAGLKLALAAASILAGYVSWRFVERPWRYSYRSISVRNLAFGASTAVVVVLCGLFYRSHLVHRTFNPDAMKLLSEKNTSDPLRHCLNLPLQACKIGAPDKAPSFILWGDSEAVAIASKIGTEAMSAGKAGTLVVTDSCPPLLGVRGWYSKSIARCADQNDFILRAAKDQQISVLIIHAYWLAALTATSLKEPSVIADLLGRTRSREDKLKDFTDKLAATINTIRRPGLTIVLIGGVPLPLANVPEGLAVAAQFGRTVELGRTWVDFKSRFGAIEETLADAARRSGVTFIQPSRSLCDATLCHVVDRGEPLFLDAGHLNPLGASKLDVLDGLFDARR
jgi:peptidoglycan/LPS O-acetylase OafA/YrhL